MRRIGPNIDTCIGTSLKNYLIKYTNTGRLCVMLSYLNEDKRVFSTTLCFERETIKTLCMINSYGMLQMLAILNVSTMGNFLMIARFFTILITPSAKVTVTTMGRPSGIAATARLKRRAMMQHLKG